MDIISLCVFFFNDTATTEIYTLSLHDALPISRRARAARPAGGSHALSRTLRVLPLGGLGEIGKNMTVLEYEDRIVVVDTGLRFPTAEMPGVDLVLPDFSYLRNRSEDIEAIVITHAHEDHVGALPWVLREMDDPPPVYGGRLTTAMARSRLDEHRLREVELEDVDPGEVIDAGPFQIETIHMRSEERRVGKECRSRW